ncbi:MAG: prolyl-tRNA synthetase associated domain-containing protein [Clostridiales bacterium]|nr:prolyl-tRNA synthetase associated domain-containing protein [Clostridiales bacterium]
MRGVIMNERSAVELKTYDVLSALNIPFERIDHEAAMTMEDCQCVEDALGVQACKNLFLRNTQKTRFYLLLLPGHKKFRTKDLSKQLGIARLSFAEEEFMEKYLGIRPGSVTVMGLMNDNEKQVTLLVDRDVYVQEYMGCHPCANTSSIKVKTQDIFEKFLPFTGHIPVLVDL